MDQLRTGLYLRLSSPKGNLYSQPEQLYLSSPYGNDDQLKALFGERSSVRFLDDVSLRRGLERLAQQRAKPVDSPEILAERPAEEAAWRKFFIQIGVEIVPHVVLAPTFLEPKQATSPDLELVLATKDPIQIRRVAAMLHANWNRYCDHLITPLTSYHRGESGSKPTKLYDLLVKHAWLPTQSGELCQPHMIFVDNPETRAVLGDDVKYLNLEFKNKRFIEDLRINQMPTTTAAIERLRRLTRARVIDMATYLQLYNLLDKSSVDQVEQLMSGFKS